MKRTNINEGWQFTKQGAGTISVDIPHTWNNLDGQDGGNDYFRGACTYTRDLIVDIQKQQQAFLEFEGANSVCTVYVNDRLIGVHRGGYSTFRFNITDALHGGGNQKIRVEVDNSHVEDIYPLMADFTFMGGLYRNVHIIVVEPVYFDLLDYGSTGVYVHQERVTPAEARIRLDSKIIFPENGKETVTLRALLIDKENRICATGSRIAEQGSSGGADENGLILTVNDLHLWQGVENPYCYKLEVQLFEGPYLVDFRVINLGLRSVAITADKGFFLNGKQVKLNGVSRHQDWQDIGWAIGEKEQQHDMALMREMGVTSVRLSHYQHNQYFYELCDTHGLLVWAEIPYISQSSITDTTGANAKLQLTELIKQNFNHPSIIMWGIQNEITMGGKEDNIENIVKDLNALAKELDPVRFSGQAQVGHHPDDDSMNSITDIIGYNKYYGWYYGETGDMASWLDTFHKQNPQTPLGITEYGCEAVLKYHSETPKKSDYTEEYQMLYHHKTLSIFSERDYLWGTYVWNMFDFASDFRDEGGVKGMNNKGLVTHNRKVRKDSFYVYKSRWTETPVLHLASRRFLNRKIGNTVIYVITNQESVSLFVNGKKAGTGIPRNNLVTFEAIKIRKGENTVLAISGEFSDGMLIQGVKNDEPSYACPEKSSNLLGEVTNWFDSGTDKDSVPVLEFPEGCFSIKDKLSVLLANEETGRVLNNHLAKMFEHPMFKMLKNMSMENIAALKPDAFSSSFLAKINSELIKFKK